MTVSNQDLLAYIGAGADDLDEVTRCLGVAQALVVSRIGTNDNVPTAIQDQAVLDCGVALFRRRDGGSGQSQYTSIDGSPLPIPSPRDPMTIAMGVLGPFIGGGFAVDV